MAASSQVSQNKRGRDHEYWNGGLASREAKRTSSAGLTLAAHDSDLMAFLDKIDNMDNNDSNPEETDIAVCELESEIRLNGPAVIESLEDEIGLKAQTENKIESSSDEKGSGDEMGSFKQGEVTADGSNSEATSLCDIRDLTYNYDDVIQAELDFFVDYIFPNDLGIIIDHNYIVGDPMANAVHGYAEAATEDFYGFLWDHDNWQLDEHPVIQN